MGNPISIQTLSGATPTWDALYKFAKITATQNVAITLENVGTPDAGVLHFKQDTTGSWTLSINGTAITVNTAGGSLTRVEWACDGENYSYHTNVTGGASGTVGATPLDTPVLTMTPGYTDMSFSWTDVANENSYTVEIAEDAGFTTGLQTASKPAGTLIHSFSGLTPSTLYYGRVKAEGSGTYSDSPYGTDSDTTTASPTYVDIDFSGANVTEETAGVYKGNTAGSFANGGVSANYLAAGANGAVRMKFASSTLAKNAVIGFSTTNAAPTAVSGISAGAYVSSGSGAIIRIDSGGAGASTGVTPTLNDYIQVIRTGSVVKIQKSADGITWTDVYTYTFASAAALYPVILIDGTSFRLYNPQGYNLS